jgi:predicted DNA-binding transcriptional regulator AlpA
VIRGKQTKEARNPTLANNTMAKEEKLRRVMLNLEQVLELVPVSGRTLQRMEKDGRFPKGVFISPNRKVWYEDIVHAWQDGLPDHRTPRKKRKRRGP